MSSRGHFVCLVFSFRYNGLATLALAGPSDPRVGPSGPLPQCTKNRVGGIRPPSRGWGWEINDSEIDQLKGLSANSLEVETSIAKHMKNVGTING